MAPHDPAGIVDSPGAGAAARCNGSPEGILYVMPFERGIDAGLGDGAGGTRRVIRGEDW